jgi:hypothetical protein
MSKIKNPFMIPPLTHSKIKLPELLEMLQERVNQQYMPTATGRVKHNGNPEYIVLKHPDYSDFPYIDFQNNSSGFYAFNSVVNKDIFVYLFLQNLHIVVNLKTLATIVKCEDGDLIFNWSATPDKGIAIDRLHLRDVLEEWIY